jgi:hypothetical protein
VIDLINSAHTNTSRAGGKGPLPPRLDPPPKLIVGFPSPAPGPNGNRSESAGPAPTEGNPTIAARRSGVSPERMAALAALRRSYEVARTQRATRDDAVGGPEEPRRARKSAFWSRRRSVGAIDCVVPAPSDAPGPLEHVMIIRLPTQDSATQAS